MPQASSLTPLSGPFREPLSGNARKLVVILHGWGADGANLIDIADTLAPAFPDTYFIAPNAPEVCEVNPYGFQWFSLMDRNPARMLEGTRGAAKILNAFVDEKLADLALQDKDFAFLGFSQGTMLSLHTSLRRTHAPACVVGFSGALIGPEVLPTEITAKPPICLVHGAMDDIVPYTALRAATAQLQSAGVNVESHTRPQLGHGIDMEGIKIAGEFLGRYLG